MPVSFANVQTNVMDLSPCRISFGGIDLGGSLGNVLVKAKYGKSDIKADQLGDTVLDRRVSSTEISVETELAQILDKDKWKVIFPHLVEATSGPNKQVTFLSKIGDGDQANAFPLILHPLSKADSDLSADHKFFLACASAESEFNLSHKDQSKMKIVWNVLPDLSGVPAKFYVFGDPTIGLINAMAGSPAFVGTGNGTLTGVGVVNGATKTETITAQLVTEAVDGGIFYVSGSVSGPLGLATVGVGFSSPVIGFTINDGTTDFVLGDTFTIATTAANYI